MKQFLEGFAFDSFAMVGTLNDDDGYHALLNLEGVSIGSRWATMWGVTMVA